jgi:hypothetical protein
MIVVAEESIGKGIRIDHEVMWNAAILVIEVLVIKAHCYISPGRNGYVTGVEGDALCHKPDGPSFED